jgi:serine/threonine protein kinase
MHDGGPSIDGGRVFRPACSMASNLLTRGDVFAGRYRIERPIGTGGVGAVFEAEHLETERKVALKVLLPRSLVSETARERFKQEARVAGKIRHPNIVEVLDAGLDDITKMPYLVMELLHGEDLGSRIDRLGPMGPEEAVALLAQIASALDCLHERSVVHRDLKPENLFLTWAEDGTRVMKLLDFGVVKVLAEGKSSALTQDAQGTPVYMAPEQFAEQIRISAATDIYALGMVAFTLLTGRHYWGPEIERGMNVFMLARVAEAGPKESATKRAQRQGAVLPSAFDEWFSVVTAIAPHERYPTAGDAVAVLADVLGVPLTTQLDSIHEKASPSMREKRAAPASTPPSPLQGPRLFWRRRAAMMVGMVAVVCVLVYALLGFTGPTPQGAAPAASATAALSFAEPPAPAAPSPTSSAPPATAPSTSSLAASSVAPATSSPSASSAPSTSSSRALRPWKQPVPATTKRPKYTRE